MKAWQRVLPRERYLAILALGIVGFWLAGSRWIQPLWDQIQGLEVELQARTEKLQALHRLLAQKSTIESDYDHLALYLHPQDASTLTGDWLEELESLSRASDLSLSLKPLPLRLETPLIRFTVELELEGSQEHLLTFLDQLLKVEALVRVEQLRLAMIPDKPGLLRATLIIQRLMVNAKDATQRSMPKNSDEGS